MTNNDQQPLIILYSSLPQALTWNVWSLKGGGFTVDSVAGGPPSTDSAAFTSRMASVAVTLKKYNLNLKIKKKGKRWGKYK